MPIKLETPPRLEFRFGTYATPAFNYDDVVTDERYGDVVVVGVTDSLLPWPTGRQVGTRRPFIILFDALADAVRNESNQTVCHWWGVTSQTVTKWRKALEVERTPGDRKRSQEVGDIAYSSGAKEGMLSKSQDPERRRKIAESKTGQKRPAHVIEALRKANTGRTPTAEARQRMSEAQKRRGATPPAAGVAWTADEDALLTLTPAEVVAKTGRTLSAVYSRRSELGLEDRRDVAGKLRQSRLYAHCVDALSELCRLRAAGSSLQSLADRLNSSGVRNRRGQEWSRNQIRTMLIGFENESTTRDR